MRKIFFFAFVAIALVSCRKKDDNGNEVNVSPNDYTLSADGLTLIKWTNSSTISIDMQGDSNLRKVNTIAENAFKDLKSLRAITFSDNLKEIGSDAFSGTNLSDGVNFNSYSDVVFGERVFYRSNIRKVVLPNTKALSNRIFADCRNLKEVTFKRTGIIGDGAFSSCGTLELVDLTDAGVTHIGKEAFANCKLLKKAILSVTMNLTLIPSRSAFKHCAHSPCVSNLRSVFKSKCSKLAFGVILVALSSIVNSLSICSILAFSSAFLSSRTSSTESCF